MDSDEASSFDLTPLTTKVIYINFSKLFLLA